MPKNFVKPKVAALLRRVEKRILEEPRRFDMDQWMTKRTGKNAPSCQTVACIGGWIALDQKTPAELVKMNDGDFLGLMWEARSIAEGRIGIDSEVANHLFYVKPIYHQYDINCERVPVGGWPMPFRAAWGKLRGKKHARARAKLAVKRIEHFIKTGE